MNQTQREIRWREMCGEFRDSGMSRKAFCESRGIAPSSFDYWLKKTSAGVIAAKSSLAMVPVGSIELTRTTVLRIRLGAEVVAELDLPADDRVIGDVLRAAASL